ncbi:MULTISPECIES: flagellar filament capping protein FliD [unclassified Cupriavidus]|jgi:flagellar hook-associated protein 2|uniref:flagellar filament capping protein FliD n=1 Tax=unclassified Cupriavidus TaxID=2640874 RepID=UPI001C007784|nr:MULTISPECIES: flagellar filament capping protein FliD [unclassified Cupriavidus]MCA3182934.1 flagellar filament capping protein FliD [Cupriavidus sp.]MCA3192495.1 flagellar filament capping protein FliD [Cupriavidus sp.]MCA3198893.1 flagellar filament capping protein FliD [Cupriavidus sp.]MCA3205255.1 flagellar filament capping protein FliD [Cupriavidus sp.]MCA3207311.1 flagellar filament capping protein FliD [Cupriavidus sp.]
MASISSIGIGSNLDLQSLLDKLQTNENTALDQINTQATSYQSQLSGYGTVKSVLDAYSAAAKTLATASTFGAVKAAVGNSSVLSATTGTNAVAGSYNINVTSLAQAQSLVSKQVADQTAAVGAGTITIDFGANLATGGTPTSTKTVTIGSDTSLQGIRDSINKAGIGVTASIINDGSGTPYHLVLTSDKTGTQSQMRVSADNSAVNDIVGYDPAQATQPSGMQEKVKAADAALTINGIDITSQTNTVAEAAQGVTLTLTATGTTSMSVTRDDASIKAAVQGFVTAYNNVLSAAKTLTAFDTDAGTKGALNGDSTLRNILTQMRSTLTTPMSDGKGGMVTLSDMGVEFSLDSSNSGSLKVNDDKLTKAIANNLTGMTAFFSGTNGASGMGKTVTDYVDGLNASGGALSAATDSLTTTLKNLETKYSDTQNRITATMDRYRAQFTQLDLLVSQMNQTSSYLTQQFSSLTSSSKK